MRRRARVSAKREHTRHHKKSKCGGGGHACEERARARAHARHKTRKTDPMAENDAVFPCIMSSKKVIPLSPPDDYIFLSFFNNYAAKKTYFWIWAPFSLFSHQIIIFPKIVKMEAFFYTIVVCLALITIILAVVLREAAKMSTGISLKMSGKWWFYVLKKWTFEPKNDRGDHVF